MAGISLDKTAKYQRQLAISARKNKLTAFSHVVMDKFRYWRREVDWQPHGPQKQSAGKDGFSSITFWGIIIMAISLIAFVLLRQNINSMYNLPGGPWSEPVYWQEHVNNLSLKALVSADWKRAALFVFSGGRLEMPTLKEFPELSAFRMEECANDVAHFQRSNPWLDNFLIAPCTLLIGKRFTNILLIVGSLFSNALAIAYLLKTLGRSDLSAALGACLFILNPLNLAALSALNWSIAYLVWTILAITFIVKIHRGENISSWWLGTIVFLAAVFCGWIALLLLVGIAIVVKTSNTYAYPDFIKNFLAIALVVYVASASFNTNLEWLVGTCFVQKSALATMALVVIMGFISVNIVTKRDLLWCTSCLISILLLPFLGKYGTLAGGLILALWWVWGLSLLPERCRFKHKYGAPLIASVLILLSMLGAEQIKLSPLPGFNSHIAPSYFLLSYMTEGKASLLELPLTKQPLYLFNQTEHGLKLVTEEQLKSCDSTSMQLLYGILTKLGQNCVGQSYEYKQLLENNTLRWEAWRQLHKRGISHFVLHERGCNWAELQKGGVSGAAYAQDYLALRALCGAPILEDYEPLSKGRWGWPRQDSREIAWYRIAIFKVPQDGAESRKNINSL